MKKKTTRRTSAKCTCKVPFKIRNAGHSLKKSGSSSAARTLATDGKKARSNRRKKGCLNGPPGTFKLTAKQKKNLPKALQEGIIRYHKKQGKKIIR